jgi:hypothetical protein
MEIRDACTHLQGELDPGQSSQKLSLSLGLSSSIMAPLLLSCLVYVVLLLLCNISSGKGVCGLKI